MLEGKDKEILDCIDNIEEQCVRLTHCAKVISGTINNYTLYDVVRKCVGVKNEDNKNIDIEEPEVKILYTFIRDYRNTGCLLDLVKFLMCLYNNEYTSINIDDKITYFIYNKLFNKKGEDENE